jgi:hypothetical protein
VPVSAGFGVGPAGVVVVVVVEVVVVVVVVVAVDVVVVTGAPATTPPVATLSTTWNAEPIVACTRATSVCETSAVTGVYDAELAPAIATHARPYALQRSHEYVMPVGVAVQIPEVTVSFDPVAAVPATIGRPMFASAPAAAMGPMRFAFAATVPVESFAVTTSPSVLPTSELVSGYVGSEPFTRAQLLPAASQRSHAYEYEIVPEPDQVPLVPVICEPARAVPTTDGSAWIVGPLAAECPRSSTEIAISRRIRLSAPREG